MDIGMPEMDGIEATRGSLAPAASPHVVILTTFDLDEYVYDALAAGASGFLLKDLPPAELLAAVRSSPPGTRSSRHGDAPADRGVRPPAAFRGGRRPARGAHRARARGAAPRRPRQVQHRDRRRSASARARSKPTSATCSPSSSSATASSSRSTPTSRASCSRGCGSKFPPIVRSLRSSRRLAMRFFSNA